MHPGKGARQYIIMYPPHVIISRVYRHMPLLRFLMALRSELCSTAPSIRFIMVLEPIPKPFLSISRKFGHSILSCAWLWHPKMFTPVEPTGLVRGFSDRLLRYIMGYGRHATPRHHLFQKRLKPSLVIYFLWCRSRDGELSGGYPNQISLVPILPYRQRPDGLAHQWTSLMVCLPKSQDRLALSVSSHTAMPRLYSIPARCSCCDVPCTGGSLPMVLPGHRPGLRARRRSCSQHSGRKPSGGIVAVVGCCCITFH